MSNIINIKSYNPKKSDRFLFDTNIWMKLYFPQGNYDKKLNALYSDFYKKIINVQASIFISFGIISEFFNAYIKREFYLKQEMGLYKVNKDSKINAYKELFRPSEDYKDAYDAVKAACIKILKCCKRIDDDFANIDMIELLENLDYIDFNDKYYTIMSKNNDFKIVTHDGDFFNDVNIDINIDVITAHIPFLC